MTSKRQWCRRAHWHVNLGKAEILEDHSCCCMLFADQGLRHVAPVLKQHGPWLHVHIARKHWWCWLSPVLAILPTLFQYIGPHWDHGPSHTDWPTSLKYRIREFGLCPGIWGPIAIDTPTYNTAMGTDVHAQVHAAIFPHGSHEHVLMSTSL